MTAPDKRPEIMEQGAEYSAIQARLLKGFSRSSWVDADFNALAGDVYAFQRRHNPLYDRYCRHLGAPGQITDWRAIPPVPQGIFKRYPIRSFPADETRATFLTSGTTAEQRGAHHFPSLRLYEAAILAGFDRAELPVLPQLVLVAPAGDAPQSSLSHMMATLARRTPRQESFVGAGRLRVADLAAALRRHAESGEPVLLLGTALAFLHWFESVSDRIALPEGSAAFETGGYKGTARQLEPAALHKLFGDRLGLPSDRIWNEYGMTELSSQLYRRGLDAPHVAPPWVRTRVIDPATGQEALAGEPGVLQIFDLANLGSVLALETRDIARRVPGGLELLGRDPAAAARGCSRSADETFSTAHP